MKVTEPEEVSGPILADRLALVGFLLYAALAPHSIAGAEIGLIPVGIAWIISLLSGQKRKFEWSSVDLPIFLFLIWTVVSSLLSEEPGLSIPKLQSVCVVFLFYLTRCFTNRRWAVTIAGVMIFSGAMGSLWSIVDLLRGRGVVVESIADDSPFRQLNLRPGDAVWRVGGKRVDSIAEIEQRIHDTQDGARLSVGVISSGEHADFPGFEVSEDLKRRENPSGLTGNLSSHRFRASGWTRHYETFSETLQMLAQLALGLAIANSRRRGRYRLAAWALAAALILSAGIFLTAMRTAMIALLAGAAMIIIRGLDGRRRVAAVLMLALALAAGAFGVWRTRTEGALTLSDPSSALRYEVARIGISRLLTHPMFGHGMDAAKRHWSEWGFPGDIVIHLHSTPLQIAFERGLSALGFWIWMMVALWRVCSNAEKRLRASLDDPVANPDLNLYGLFLGSTGAIVGFFLSSLVNYNFGDAEVILVFWWLNGTVLALKDTTSDAGCQMSGASKSGASWERGL
jgi:hypothetical protein